MLRRKLAILLIGIGVFASSALAQQATPAVPIPAQSNDARNRVQNWLLASISRMPDAEYLHGNIGASDVARVKGCVVQAIVAGIPDKPAEEIAEALSQNPPQKNDAVETWIFGSFEKNSARRREVMTEIARLCPEYKDKIF